MTLSNPTVEANVPTWAQKYCDALEANYRAYHIDSMKRMASRSDSSTYANEQLEKIESGEAVNEIQSNLKEVFQDYSTGSKKRSR